MTGTIRLPSGAEIPRGAPDTVLSDSAKLQMVRAHLDLIMSQIDYTRGLCRPQNQIGTLVRPDYLETVRNALELSKAEPRV